MRFLNICIYNVFVRVEEKSAYNKKSLWKKRKLTASPTRSLKSKLLSKLLLKPASLWFSCAHPNNQTLHQSTFYFNTMQAAAPQTTSIYTSLIETNLNTAASTSSEAAAGTTEDDRSHEKIMVARSTLSSATAVVAVAAGDTGYETLTTANFDLMPTSTLFQVCVFC